MIAGTSATRTIVIAVDSFKGTISATDASAALREGWRSERPDDDIRLLPMVDGGEGTIDASRAAAVPPARWLTEAGRVLARHAPTFLGRRSS